MAQKLAYLMQIENLDENQLAEALEMNGYATCVGAVRTKHIDGQAFLKLTELQLSLWRLPGSDARRLWSFMQQVKQDPTQFLINSQISNKTSSKGNSLSKSTINNTKMYSNIDSKSQFSSNKSNISAKPNQLEELGQTEETKELNSPTLMKQQSKLLKDKEEVEQISERGETNSSTLTKHESKLLKNKLEQFFKKDSNETSNNSFIHNQRQPVLPPKPDHLKVTAPKQDEDLDVCCEDYLEPRQVDPNQPKDEPQIPEIERRPTFSKTDSRRGSFLHKFRKNYDNLEIRPKVIENKYEEQTAKQKPVAQTRPLPPVPMETRKYTPPVGTFTANDEDLAEYTSVPEEEPNLQGKSYRPLPPIPIEQVTKINRLSEAQQHTHHWLNAAEDDAELAEYTPVIEDDEAESKSILPHRIIKTPRSPLPPSQTPVPPIPISKIKERPGIPLPDVDNDCLPKRSQVAVIKPKASLPTTSVRSFSTLPKSSSTSEKLDAKLSFSATLPKPPTNLPKPPMALPSPPNFLNNPQNDLPDFNFREGEQLPLPPTFKTENATDAIAVEADDEESFYTEIDLARESSYRETDRKGARRLLSGLADGAFVIRPSRKPEFICTISVMHSKKMFNLGIERNSAGTLAFGSVTPDFDQPKFYSVSEIITYYSLHPLYLSGESITLKDILPRNKY